MHLKESCHVWNNPTFEYGNYVFDIGNKMCCDSRASTDWTVKAGAPEIPMSLLGDSYADMCPGGYEKPTLGEYEAAVRGLISALIDRGSLICAPAFDIPSPSNRANLEHIHNTSIALRAGKGRV